jgi:hypothetical protein
MDVTYLEKEKVFGGPFCWTQIYLMMVIERVHFKTHKNLQQDL